MNVAVMARDEHGAPRIVRAILPRPGLTGATPAAIARDHVAALAPLWLQKTASMALVDNGTQELRNGATVVTLAQQAGGVPVEGGDLRVLMHKDGSFAAVSGTLLPSAPAPQFNSSATAALDRALDQQFGGTRPQLAIRAAAVSDGGWQQLSVASTAQLQVDDARARQVLTMVGDQPTAAWEVEFFGQTPPDPHSEDLAPQLSSRSLLVADGDGAILRNVDLEAHDAFVYRAYAETTGNRRPLDGPLQSFTPHPTGVPDGSQPGPISSNLVVMEAFNNTGDPWLPSNALTATGNNAEVVSDLDGNGNPSPGEARPEVQSGRILNYAYDQTQEALGSPDQLKAGAVNSFFLVNWMHDWWYDSGFTEVTRDGQVDNFGRGGIANDSLLILAQAGANSGSRNNASMATPNDGARPRMRMFLWTAGADTVFTGPNGVAPSDAFSAGPRTFSVTGTVVIGVDATPPTDDGCQALSNIVAGKIALLTFSGTAICNSQAVVNNAKAAGAAGVILIDPDFDTPRAFGGSATANLPGLVLGRSDGLALKTALAGGPVTVTLVSTARGPERDGDLDNTVVGHEWGHYLHHRLAVCNAGQQCNGMSEGWGDFNALMLILREGDNRNGVYAMAPYALDDGTANTAYFGIRRFPYSRDRTKNDLSFRHISDGIALPTATLGIPNASANSEVHNVGEIWASMMWEVLNTLADAHGVTIARRRMTDYVVTGLLLAPTNATFTEQRDAILIGASALDTDDMLLMAAAFAGRGIGSCAVSPARTSATNAGVVESGTIAAKLSTGSPRIADDGKADHDGILESGESGSVHVVVANSGPLSAEQVTLSATSSVAGVTIGAPKPLGLLPPFSNAELTIPVSVAASVPGGTSVTLTLRVAGQETCDRNGLTSSFTFTVGTATLTGVAGLDHSDAANLSTIPVTVRSAPSASLSAFDADVCILQESAQ